MVTREPVGNLPTTRHANIRRRNKGILQISPPTSSRACITRYQRRHVDTDEQRNSILTWNLHLGKVALVLVISILEKYRKYSLLRKVYVCYIYVIYTRICYICHKCYIYVIYMFKKVQIFKNETNLLTCILFVIFLIKCAKILFEILSAH